MFEDQKEALRLLKKNPGARFKVFRSRKDAESFAGLRENLSTPRSAEPENKGKSATAPVPKVCISGFSYKTLLLMKTLGNICWMFPWQVAYNDKSWVIRSLVF